MPIGRRGPFTAVDLSATWGYSAASPSIWRSSTTIGSSCHRAKALRGREHLLKTPDLVFGLSFM
jgi:hypothetical protein